GREVLSGEIGLVYAVVRGVEYLEVDDAVVGRRAVVVGQGGGQGRRGAHRGGIRGEAGAYAEHAARGGRRRGGRAAARRSRRAGRCAGAPRAARASGRRARYVDGEGERRIVPADHVRLAAVIDADGEVVGVGGRRGEAEAVQLGLAVREVLAAREV